MTDLDIQHELREVKRRLDLAEAKLAQQAGQFEFISGQLRDVQLYIHARFRDIDARFERIDARFDRLEAKMDSEFAAVRKEIRDRIGALESKVDALPRVLAEMLQGRET